MLPNAQTYEGLGGELVDLAPVVDPTTDLPAEAMNELRSDAAAMTRTAARAVVVFTAGAVPAVTMHDAVWGNTPGVKPTVVRSMAGVYVVTWPASVTDARGVSRGVALRAGLAGSGTAGWIPTAAKTASNAFTVMTWGLGGGAVLDPPDAPITLMVL